MVQDIRRGQVFEDYIEDYFKQRGWTTKRAKGYTPGYDLCITKDRSSLFLEVKHDLMSDKTNNYALELASLEHTQSDYFVIGTPNEAYILSTQEVKNLFNQYPKKQTGDFLDNYSAIVPKQIIQANYKRL